MLAGLLAVFPLLGFAQAAQTGAIAGRISNPANGSYLRDAKIVVVGTDIQTTAEDGGVYRVSGINPGVVTVSVSYIGYNSVIQTVVVNAGQTSTYDVELISAAAATLGADSTLELETFVVTSEREGNAKAIMQQRNSMDITNSVATDVFGENSEGNIGEFLKHMPGVDIVEVDGGIRNIRLRGLGAEYTGVTVDGVSIAGADANTGSAGDARALSFEQVSLSSIDSIQISKTVSADVDASSPAGTINLKSKRAFDRKGRRISWQANASAFSETFSLSKVRSPDESNKRRTLPGGSLEYSDVFFDQRLGIVVSLSQAYKFSMITQNSTTYNFVPTATDPRPAVITAMTLNRGSRIHDRTSASFSTDFKATERLTLSLSSMYNYFDQWSPRTNIILNSGGRTTVVGQNPLLKFSTVAPGSNIVANSQAIQKLSETFTVVPRFEYKQDDLMIEGRFSASVSESSYDPFYGEGAIANFGNPTLNGVAYQAERSSLTRGDWTIQQTGGPDWSNGAGFTSPILTLLDGRYAYTQVYSGELLGTLKTKKHFPIVWKTGVKMKREIRDFDVSTNGSRYSYIGPGAGVGSWSSYASPYTPTYGAIDSTLTSSSGKPVFTPGLLKVGQLFNDHPEYFSRVISTTDYYNAYIANKKHYIEDINSAFLMGTTVVGRTSFRAGLRWEETSGNSHEFNPRSAAELAAAGFAETNGRAVTIPGLEYQFFSKSKVQRRGRYDNFFPSTSLKYQLTDRLDAQFGYSETIRRPTFRDIVGVWSINDDSQRVSAPNPRLLPEYSDNLSARLAYYFEPIGIIAVSAFQNTVTGLFRTTEMTAQEFGNTDPELDDYIFTTTISSADKTLVRGWELEYSQSLSFLPRPLNGLNIRGSYTRTYSEVITPQMTPHNVAAGLSYGFKRLNLNVNFTWKDDSPLDIIGNTYLRHRSTVDAGGGYRITDKVSFFFTAKNLLNAPQILMTRQVIPATSTAYRVWGTEWAFGLKGTF